MSIFTSKKSLEIFNKNSADKIWSKNDEGIEVSPLMPIRDNIMICGKYVQVKEQILQFSSLLLYFL